MTNKSSILCIGEVLIDMICTDKGKPLSEGENFLKKAGGAPANVAAAIAALGGHAVLLAKAGVDPFGKHLEHVLAGFNVDTKYLYKSKEQFTTFAFVSLMESGERDFYFNRGADAHLNSDETAAADISDCSIIHFGSATAFLPGPLKQSYLQLLQRAQQHNKFVSFDPNYRELLFGKDKDSFKEQSWNFLKQCHLFKVSDEEALLLTRATNVEDAAAFLSEHTNAVFVITLGAKGTLLGYKGQHIIIESIKVNPVDTTGAGDAFIGALLYQLATNYLSKGLQPQFDDYKEMVRLANKAGAKTCEYLGAMEAFKHLSSSILQ